MTTATETVAMTRAQVESSGLVLSRAFYDDPMMIWILPDDAKRPRGLDWFMTRAALYGHKFGDVYTTAGKVDGNAIWLPPGDTDVPVMRLLRAGMLAAPLRLGMSPFGRFMKAMSFFEKLHHRDAPEKHWYLMVLGVDPSRQGQGVGGSLIAPTLARADADGLSCYLETAKERNVTFYRKHGFEVVVEDDVPDGFHYWTMKRPPRA